MSYAVSRVLDAYNRLAFGDPLALIDLLDADVVWSAPGSRPEVGREHVVSRLTAAAGAPVELVAVRRGESVVVLEFTRPWWKARNRRAHRLRTVFDIHGEQAVWVKNGLISKIEARERTG